MEYLGQMVGWIMVGPMRGKFVLDCQIKISIDDIVTL